MGTQMVRWREQVQGTLDQMKFLADLAADPDILKALHAIDCLSDEAAALRTRAVKAAREQGATWEDIGIALGGISRQAAWDRFRALGSDTEDPPKETNGANRGRAARHA